MVLKNPQYKLYHYKYAYCFTECITISTLSRSHVTNEVFAEARSAHSASIGTIQLRLMYVSVDI